jgi:hypothetical protein
MPKNPHSANLVHNVVASDHRCPGSNGKDIGNSIASMYHLDWHNMGRARDFVEGYRQDRLDAPAADACLNGRVGDGQEDRGHDVDGDDNNGKEERHNLLRNRIVWLPYTLQD